MPEDEARINQALVKAALMKRSDSHKSSPQSSFDFGESERILAPLQAQWQDALEKARLTAPSLPSAVSALMRCCLSGKNSKKH